MRILGSFYARLEKMENKLFSIFSKKSKYRHDRWLRVPRIVYRLTAVFNQPVSLTDFPPKLCQGLRQWSPKEACQRWSTSEYALLALKIQNLTIQGRRLPSSMDFTESQTEAPYLGLRGYFLNPMLGLLHCQNL